MTTKDFCFRVNYGKQWSLDYVKRPFTSQTIFKRKVLIILLLSCLRFLPGYASGTGQLRPDRRELACHLCRLVRVRNTHTWEMVRPLHQGGGQKDAWLKEGLFYQAERRTEEAWGEVGFSVTMEMHLFDYLFVRWQQPSFHCIKVYRTILVTNSVRHICHISLNLISLFINHDNMRKYSTCKQGREVGKRCFRVLH
jgi:hypothetical protein